MKFGYLTVNDAQGIRPDRLAGELEDRGFDSIWVPEHSHIPTSRKTQYPGGKGPLPDSYLHNMNPLVSIAAAAAATETLTMATGVVLLLEHDLLDLACAIATTDVLCDGRLLLGIGVGWNEEELANHRPDVAFKQRYSAMEERVAALRTIWAEEEPEFAGRWDSFEKSWVYPKPTQPSVPIALGNAGPLGMRHAARYADHWCPIDAGLANTDGKPNVAAGIGQFREMLAEEGRKPEDVPISLFTWGHPRPDRLESYAELGVEAVVLPPPSMMRHSADETLRHLDTFKDLVEMMS